MIYVTGDGMAAAAYAVAPYSYASQDLKYRLRGRIAHPANFDASFGKFLSNVFHLNFQLDASQNNSHQKILRGINHVIYNNQVNYLVVTFPNFYRSELLLNDILYQFELDDHRDTSLPATLREAIRKHNETWDLDNWMPGWIEDLFNLTVILRSRNIKYSFIMSNTLVPKTIDFGNWLFDPNKETIVSWANKQQNNLLNAQGFLTKAGHIELAKLLVKNLTEQ